MCVMFAPVSLVFAISLLLCTLDIPRCKITETIFHLESVFISLFEKWSDFSETQQIFEMLKDPTPRTDENEWIAILEICRLSKIGLKIICSYFLAEKQLILEASKFLFDDA